MIQIAQLKIPIYDDNNDFFLYVKYEYLLFRKKDNVKSLQSQNIKEYCMHV